MGMTWKLEMLFCVAFVATSHASDTPVDGAAQCTDKVETYLEEVQGAALLAIQFQRNKTILKLVETDEQSSPSKVGDQMHLGAPHNSDINDELQQKVMEVLNKGDLAQSVRSLLIENEKLRRQAPVVPAPVVPSDIPGAEPVVDIENITFAKEPAEKKHQMSRYFVAPLAFVFFTIFTLSALMEKFEVTYIPESGIIIALGAGLGIFMKTFAGFDIAGNEEAFSKIMSNTLNLILLPIIIFESGWNLRRQDFYSQFPYILMFALIGTAVSTVVIAALIHVSGFYFQLHGVTSIRTALAYASLVSATDPVSTLSTYSALKVDPVLNIMVFGESLLNDAVAIVLFNVFNSDAFMGTATGEEMTGIQLMISILQGVGKILTGSVSLGVLLGMGYTLISKKADMHQNKRGQILAILASCYLTYAVAESVSMSGIVAVMFCAILMGIYMRPHLSIEGCLLANYLMKQLGTLADSSVFLLVGVSVMNLEWSKNGFALLVMLFCMLGRVASTFPIGVTVNIFKTAIGKATDVPQEGWNLLSFRHMFMIWHAGLRGGIALVLSLELGEWVDIAAPGTRKQLQSATFIMIIVFLVLFGGTTTPFLKALSIPLGIDAPPDVLSKTGSFMGPAKGFLSWLDTTVLSPVLIGEGSSAAEEEEKDLEELLRRAATLDRNTSGGF